MFVWVCAYECVLEQKAQADATLFEQQQLPSSQQAGDLSRTAVGSQSVFVTCPASHSTASLGPFEVPSSPTLWKITIREWTGGEHFLEICAV